MKTTNTKESGLEEHIIDYLINENGYTSRSSKDYDKVNCA